MYAILGKIKFDLIAYWSGYEAQYGSQYAEHALIEGKPRLQFVGDTLDEIRIQLSFHRRFCDPEVELTRLRKALASHEAMSFSLGNGDYKGWFVLTALQATSRQTDQAGSLVSLEASITLREYVGDKLHPLPPPAVQPKVPPAMALAQPASGTLAVASSTATHAALRAAVQQAVTLLKQGSAAIAVARDAVRVAQKMRENPSAALSVVPDLLSSVQRATEPLAKLSPTLSAFTSKLPDAATLIKAGSRSLDAVHKAADALKDVTLDNVTARIESVAMAMDDAAAALDSVAPIVSKLSADLATRVGSFSEALRTGADALREVLREALPYIEAARPALRAAKATADFLRTLRNDPREALKKAPDLYKEIEAAIKPLAEAVPKLAEFAQKEPDAAKQEQTKTLKEAANTAWEALKAAREALDGITLDNAVERINALEAPMSRAVDALEKAQPAIRALADKIAKRIF
ncbi:phage tail protein [Trinickia sp. YCB016]